jgi:hypothetical protein
VKATKIVGPTAINYKAATTSASQPTYLKRIQAPMHCMIISCRLAEDFQINTRVKTPYRVPRLDALVGANAKGAIYIGMLVPG